MHIVRTETDRYRLDKTEAMPTKASPPTSMVPASLIAPHSLESVPWISQYPFTTADTSCIKLWVGMIIDPFYHI